MKTDPIDEVRRHRETLLAKHNFDLRELAAALNTEARRSGRKLTRRVAKPKRAPGHFGRTSPDHRKTALAVL
jgi:ParB-like chromosome segregation protein Spo0J